VVRGDTTQGGGKTKVPASVCNNFLYVCFCKLPYIIYFILNAFFYILNIRLFFTVNPGLDTDTLNKRIPFYCPFSNELHSCAGLPTSAALSFIYEPLTIQRKIIGSHMSGDMRRMGVDETMPGAIFIIGGYQLLTVLFFLMLKAGNS
jgi:hypothetical protein